MATSNGDPISSSFKPTFSPSKISIFYSEKNIYNNPKPSMRILLEKDPSFKEAIRQLNLFKQKTSLTEYKEKLDTSVTEMRAPMSSKDLKDSINTKAQEMAKNGPPDEIEKHKKLLKMQLYGKRGSILGKEYAKKLLEEGKITRIEKTVRRSYSLYEISGRIDAINAVEGTIIEIKHISEDKPKKIKTKDRIQCLIYMDITDYRSCEIHQVNPQGEILITTIEYDQDFVNRIHKQLSNLVTHIRKYTIDDVKKIFQ